MADRLVVNPRHADFLREIAHIIARKMLADEQRRTAEARDRVPEARLGLKRVLLLRRVA